MNTLTTMKHKFIAKEKLVTAYVSWEEHAEPLIPRILTKLPTIFKEYISNFEDYGLVWDVELKNDWVLKISYLKFPAEELEGGLKRLEKVPTATFLFSVDSDDGYITYDKFQDLC